MTAVDALEHCLGKLNAGQLTADDLQSVIALLRPGGGRPVQDLLYLQCSGTSVTAPVIGMATIKNGQAPQERIPYKQWPYATVLDAMRDGWRVIQFPNLALMLDESRTYGLGCEFILERMGTMP
jgi:hypothetical protein